MLKAFQDALEAGQVEPVTFPNGQPFVIDGIQYYQTSGGTLSGLLGRFHGLADTLRRHDALKLDSDLLATGFTALLALQKRIRAQATLDTEQVLDATHEAITILERLEQRRAFGLDVSQVYEIASIYYFSENEDPGHVDETINRTKINGWATSERASELYNNFLRMPIASFVDSQALSEKSILTYIHQSNELELLDWSRLQLMLKMSGAASETLTSTIELRKSALYAYDGLLRQVLDSPTPIVQPGLEVPSEQPAPADQ